MILIVTISHILKNLGRTTELQLPVFFIDLA